MEVKLLLGGLVAACAIAPVHAQQVEPATNARPAAKEAPAAIGEIVVTALRGRTDLQKAPAAITSVSGAALKTQGVVDIRGVQNIVPEVHFGIENTSTQVFIRGVGSSLDFYWIPETVALNIDGVYTPRYATAGSFLDIASVQVLPGPQGVLYGRSAGGGAIVITSNAPSNSFESTGDGEFGSYGLVHLTGVQNIPITDQLAIRGGVEYLRHDGYQSLGLDAQNSVAAKLALRYRPTDKLTIDLRGSYYQDKGKPASTTYVPFVKPSNPWFIASTDPVTGLQLGDESRDYDYYTASADVKYDLGPATLEYQAGRLHQDGIENRAIVGATSLLDQHYTQYTQSLKASSNKGSRLQWIAGVDWFSANARYSGLFGPHEFGNIFPKIRQRSYSGYAQLTYSLTDHLRLVGGGRYSVDSLKLNGVSSACFYGTCSYPPVTFDKTYRNADYKAGVEADLATHVLAYANVQSGYAPGSLNTFTDASGLSKNIKPQSLTAFTAGVKTRFAEQRVTLNLEGYYYKYKDLIIQAFDDATGEADLFNAPKATIYGATLTTTVRITDNDRLNGAVAYTHGRYGHFVASLGDRDLNGLQMQYTPDWTGSASYEHNFPLASGASILAHVGTYISSRYWGTFDHSPQTDQAFYTKTDLTLTYNTASGRWSVAAWVKNIENTAVKSSISASGYPAPYAATTFLDAPRTAGVRLGFKL